MLSNYDRSRIPARSSLILYRKLFFFRLIEPGAFALLKLQSLKQVRAVAPRFPERLPSPEARNLSMIAALQNDGDAHVSELRRSRVVRKIQHSFREGIVP